MWLCAQTACQQGLQEGVQGVHRTRARTQGARKSSGFRVKFWCRTQWRIYVTKFE